MDSLLSAIILVSSVVYLALLIYTQFRRKDMRGGRVWLSLTILFGLFAALTFFIPDTARLGDKIGRGFGLAISLAAMTAAFGALIISDIRRTAKSNAIRIWLCFGVIWIAALIIST